MERENSFEIYNLVNYLDFDAENNKIEVKELRNY